MVNPDSIFRFHLNRIVLHICGQINLFVSELEVFVVDLAYLDIKKSHPILVLAHKDIQLIKFLSCLAQVGIKTEIACASSARTGKTGGNILTVGGCLLLDNFELLVIPAPQEIIAADIKKD